jgi:hypothetical protein
MIEDRIIWIGDEVEVPAGRGVVAAVETWRSKVDGMSEVKAKAFCEQCRREVGVDFRHTWGIVLVEVAGKPRWYPIASVRVVRGRDG